MSSDQVIKIKVNENDQEYILRYKLLNTCEFTSTRKRQSSILQNLETEEIILYTKGADNVIKELLSKDIDQSEMVAETEKFVDDYAKDGLRTLFLGKKEIQRNDYDAWNKKFEQAQLSTVNREAEMAKVNGEIE